MRSFRTSPILRYLRYYAKSSKLSILVRLPAIVNGFQITYDMLRSLKDTIPKSRQYRVLRK